MARQPEKVTAHFLPNFCANQNVFLIVLIAELLAFVLALSNTIQAADFWAQLGILSLLIQWLALGSAAMLCWAQSWLQGMSTAKLTLTAYGLTQMVTISLSLLGLGLLNYLGARDLLPDDSYRFIGHCFAISSIVVLLALRYFYIHHQWQLNVQAQAESRLQSLQARIRPHFLFNSLNTIASLTRSQPEQAEYAVLDLADLFRLTLKNDTMVTLSEELELSRGYLKLEQLRLGERLQVCWQIAESLPLDARIPGLILQPLLENAVYHGVERSPDGGIISVSIDSNGRKLQICIENSVGLGNGHSGSGIALENIRRRLQLLYGERGHLTTQASTSEFKAIIQIPID